LGARGRGGWLCGLKREAYPERGACTVRGLCLELGAFSERGTCAEPGGCSGRVPCVERGACSGWGACSEWEGCAGLRAYTELESYIGRVVCAGRHRLDLSVTLSSLIVLWLKAP